MDITLKKMDSFIRSGFSPSSTSTLDGIGYQFNYHEFRPDSRFEPEIRDRKKFDDEDELCKCVDPCDEVYQVRHPRRNNFSFISQPRNIAG